MSYTKRVFDMIWLVIMHIKIWLEEQFQIKYFMKKDSNLLVFQNIIDVKEDLRQWFINFSGNNLEEVE